MTRWTATRSRRPRTGISIWTRWSATRSPQRDLVTLATYGVLHGGRSKFVRGEEGIRFHGTVEVILEAFSALEMLNELDGSQ